MENCVRTFFERRQTGRDHGGTGKELNVPLYWIRPPQIFSAKGGMHRFIWDLRTPTPGSVQHEYPISAIVHDTPR